MEKQVRIVLLAILLGFPLLEAVVLVRLSETLGWWVLAWVVLAACAGMALIKEARFAMVARLAAGLSNGTFQISALTDSAIQHQAAGAGETVSGSIIADI